MDQRLVLVVDDDPDSREIAAEYVEFAGFRSATAENGEVALARVRELSPSLILMDLAMPVMDGLTAIRHLQEDPATAGIPVIVLTGQGPDASRTALLAGARAVCTKPCPPDELITAICSAMA